MKKCFLLCEILALILLFAGCSSKPVYIADEIDVDELWNFSETASYAEIDHISDTTEETEKLPAGDGVVYYTESGSVWHTTPDCSSLSRSKTVVSGTVEQAMAAGAERVCKRCG